MFKFFDFLVGIIETIVNLFVSFVEIIVYVLGFIFQGITYIGTCVAYLPSWVAPFVIAILAYVSIITLLNKGK